MAGFSLAVVLCCTWRLLQTNFSLASMSVFVSWMPLWFIVAIFSLSSLHNASRRRWRDIPVGEKGEWKAGKEGGGGGIGLLYDISNTEGQCRRAWAVLSLEGLEVSHYRAWSPNGWVTVMCPPRYFSGHAENFSPEKSQGRHYAQHITVKSPTDENKPRSPACKKVTRAR